MTTMDDDVTYEVVAPCQHAVDHFGDGDPMPCERDVRATVVFEPGEPQTWDSPGAPAQWSVVTEHVCPLGHGMTAEERAALDQLAIDAAQDTQAALAEEPCP
jgi:hypothetical protein